MSQDDRASGRLTDLDATFIRHIGGGNFEEVAAMADANGVLFDCPRCGRHSVLVWDHSVPSDIDASSGRWTMSGTGLDDLTLQPSVDLSRSGIGCQWHGWVENGVAT